MKNKPMALTIILMLLLSMSAFFYFRSRSENPPVGLVTTKIHYGPIENVVTATGTLQPVDTVAIGSQVSGTIKRIYADYNSVVKKGQLIAILDTSLLAEQAAQHTATLQSMESQLTYNKQNLDRQTQLFISATISKADYETAVYQYQTALAGVNSEKAQLAAALQNLSYASIRSPISGTVLSRNISEGQTVAASFNTPVLFSIAKDLTRMQVRAAVDEADIGNVAQGQPVSFTVDAFPDEVFNGTVEEVRLQPVATANVVTYITIINAPNHDKKLKPGMTANINIYTRREKNAALIPASAINFIPGPILKKKYDIIADTNPTPNDHPIQNEKDSSSSTQKSGSVWILNGNELTMKKIKTGLNDNINVQVLSGLNQDDLVVEGTQETKKKDNPAEVNSPFLPSRRSPARK